MMGGELPKGWEWTDLENVIEVLDRLRVPIKSGDRAKRTGDIPYYGATGRAGWIDDFIFDEDLILLGEDGAPFFDHTKNVAYMIRGKSWVNNHAHVLRGEVGILNSFLLHQLNIVDFHPFVSGTTRLKLPQGPMRQIPLLIPPTNEQQRIVSKIEELFSELDDGIASLKTARAQLKIYRQALLKHAFEGKLTEPWRKAHAAQLESADQLLARITKEREAHYQQQLKDWKQAVKKWEAGPEDGSKPSKPQQPKAPVSFTSVEIKEFPELPANWVWIRLGANSVNVFDGPFGSNLMSSDYVSKGVRVVRLENIGEGEFVEDKYSFITQEKYQSLEKHTVYPGDLVFSSFITERTRVALIPASIERAVNKADCFCVCQPQITDFSEIVSPGLTGHVVHAGSRGILRRQRNRKMKRSWV